MTDYEKELAAIEAITKHPFDHPRTKLYVIATIRSLRNANKALSDELEIEKRVNTKFMQVLRDACNDHNGNRDRYY